MGLASAEDQVARAGSELDSLRDEVRKLKCGAGQEAGEVRARLAEAEAQLEVLSGEWDAVKGEVEGLKERLGVAEGVREEGERARRGWDEERKRWGRERERIERGEERERGAREEAEAQVRDAVKRLAEERNLAAEERGRSMASLLDLEGLYEAARADTRLAAEEWGRQREARERAEEEVELMGREVAALKDEVAALERIKLMLQAPHHEPPRDFSSRFRLLLQGSAPVPPGLAEGLASDISNAAELGPGVVKVERVGAWYSAVDCRIGGGEGAWDEELVGEALGSLIEQLGDPESTLMRGRHTRGVASFELLPEVAPGEEDHPVEVRDAEGVRVCI